MTWPEKKCKGMWGYCSTVAKRKRRCEMEKEVSPVAMVKSLNHVLSTRRLVFKSPTLPFGPIIVLGALDHLCNIQGNLPPPSARVTPAVLGQTPCAS